MCLASLEKMRLEAVCLCVCVLIIITIPPTAPSKSPSAKQYHHPIVDFQSSTQPSTLPDYLQKTRSADGIQYNSLLPKKSSKKTTSTMLIHPPTLSSIIMGSVENYPKNSGKRSWYRRYSPKNPLNHDGRWGYPTHLKKYAQVKLDHETPRVRVKITHTLEIQSPPENGNPNTLLRRWLNIPITIWEYDWMPRDKRSRHLGYITWMSQEVRIKG